MSVFLFLETLRNYFSQYGEVVDCVIMKDKTTNQSRGFGFVKFKDPNCVRTVLETKPHNLDGRNIDPKPCTPRGMQPEKSRTKEGWKGSKADSNKSKKIFVGGIPHNCGEPELRDYFNRFGVVTEVVMIYDAEKQRPRGFGFITFEAEQSVDQAVNMHFHDIMGKKVCSCSFILPLRSNRGLGDGGHVYYNAVIPLSTFKCCFQLVWTYTNSASAECQIYLS
uniref:DAZ associated protein 1 n=1 Tax=Oryzias sinensis TaxID=183150 RepID=A0A8C7ZNG4_9TELE